jgi:hypothetical protein
MKSKIMALNLHAKLLALALMLASANSGSAQTWQTVLDYQLAPGKAADGPGIVADALGNVFSGGNGFDASGTNHGIVWKTDTNQLAKTDLSTINWYLSEDTNPDPTQYQSYIWDLGLDAGGNLYSIGQLTPNSTGIPYWYVRKSSDRGLTWTNAGAPYQYAAGQWIDATGFAADDLTNIYVAGWGQAQTIVGSGKHATTQIYNHWLVRKSADGGQTWTLVDDVQVPAGSVGAAGAGFVPGAGVFVVGDPYASSASSWLVRRSLNGEQGTWSTVDSSLPGSAAAVGSDSLGNIYVTGAKWITTATKPHITGYSVWVTRESSDGGTSWSTVDTFALAQKDSKGLGIGRNSDGKVVVAGHAYDAQNKWHWIVRTPDASGAFTTMDDFQPGNGASALGVVTDAAGDLLVTGNAQDANGFHWIVRKLAP